jgi:6-methylsalicylate decarboxylase
MVKIDVHQHLWSPQLVQALRERRELPFVRTERGLTVLFIRGERPYLIDLSAETAARRAALVELDGLDGALLCLSSPLDIESLPRPESQRLIDAYQDGALSLDAPFGVWGAIALEGPDPGDVDRALELGCVGISLPAGALAGVEKVSRLNAVLARLEELDLPLLVHPGGGPGMQRGVGASLQDPLWWPAMTTYLAQMQASWMAFVTAGRGAHPELRVIFAALAGLAPLHAERLQARGGPPASLTDPLIFYDTSSYGPRTVRSIQALVGAGQLLYGSDRPVVEPELLEMPHGLDWDPVAEGTLRAFSGAATAAVR